MWGTTPHRDNNNRVAQPAPPAGRYGRSRIKYGRRGTKVSAQAFSDSRTEPPGRPGSRQRRVTMPDHVYRIIEVAGSSEKSIEDAIQNAVGRASRTLRQVGWVERGG